MGLVQSGWSASATPNGIDRAGVERWFEANVERVKPPLSFEMITGGRSNLTYLVTDSGSRRWALRRPPLGNRLGSAHDMGREHKVVSALAPTPVPVPRLAGYCEDETVNGAPFYAMEFLDGPILRSREDADDIGLDERRAISERVVDTLVTLHDVDPDDAGLGDLGKKTDHVARILRRWLGQWEKSKTRDLRLVKDVHDRLAARIPEQGPATIVHGDYRLDNMIFDRSGEVAAVVDWELCTLGDPLTDVGLLLVYWAEECDDLLPLSEPATMAPGFIGRDEVKARYAECSGRDLGEIDFYVALGYWKLAIILEGVLARYVAGQYDPDAAEDKGAKKFARTVERLVGAAHRVLVCSPQGAFRLPG